MNESLVKYLSGLLDADGSVSFSFKEDRNRPGRYFIGLRINLASSDAVDRDGFIDSLPDITKMGSISRYGDSKQFKTWTVNRRADMEMLLPRLIKHMVIKAKHWEWMLGLWREARSENKTCSAQERQTLVQAAKESRRLNRGPLKPKNHPTWAWLAGYLDGDGWYSYRRSSGQWHMQVGAVAHINDIAALEFICRSFGGRIQDHGQSPNVKCWVRSLGYHNRAFALEFLPKLVRHSRLKRYKIEQIIHHHRQRLSVPGVKAQATV